MGDELISTVINSVLATGVTGAIGMVGRAAYRRITQRKPPPAGWTIPSNPQLFSQTRVLVIDNQGEDELAHIAQLRNRGFTVEKWDSVIHDKSRRLEASFDLLLLDNRGVSDAFGAASGIDAVELIRRDNPWIPMFLFTSYPEDVSPTQKKTLKRMRVPVLPKITRFAEFEQTLVTALSESRTRAFFLSVLSECGLPDPSAIIDAYLHTRRLPDLPMITDPYQKTNAERLLIVADDIYSGMRWQQKGDA